MFNQQQSDRCSFREICCLGMAWVVRPRHGDHPGTDHGAQDGAGPWPEVTQAPHTQLDVRQAGVHVWDREAKSSEERHPDRMVLIQLLRSHDGARYRGDDASHSQVRGPQDVQHLERGKWHGPLPKELAKRSGPVVRVPWLAPHLPLPGLLGEFVHRDYVPCRWVVRTCIELEASVDAQPQNYVEWHQPCVRQWRPGIECYRDEAAPVVHEVGHV
mmetsp:Transcript_146615/g.372061  ORF Transcript_146615/g.372061 Transcript_146615/m.372061 type:complete len:215 (-) Transcript_146615:470-1114(-)